MRETQRLATLALLGMPIFFSTNLVIGRAAIGSVEPMTLAFLRWFLAFLILLPFTAQGLLEHAPAIVARWRALAGLAFLGMVICGGVVYWALLHTSATNGTLIYTSSPVLIVALDWLLNGRRVGGREVLGIGLGLGGVLTIVLKGSASALLHLQFNTGDLIFAAAALAFAVYSLALKRPELKQLPTLVLFSALALAASIELGALSAVEIAVTGRFPLDATSWFQILGLAVVSSILAFLSLQYGIKIRGASEAGLYFYLMPIAGVAQAALFLGEPLYPYHAIGLALVLGGVIVATLPIDVLRGLVKARV